MKHVNICICTFQRPAFLKRLLHRLQLQQADNQFDFSIVVADNDAEMSARPVVDEFAVQSRVETVYSVEPHQNIALARNKALEHSKGEFIAFIDDDEFPESDWLLMMLQTCEAYNAAGVLGPVKPHFEEEPPRWIVEGRFCERPEHPTGRIMEWDESRTGNLLFRRSILDGTSEAFKPEFGNGGEDKDFFQRMTQKGHVFRWCNEGVVYETVPKVRWKRIYMLRRALLRGKNILKHPSGRIALVARSFVAAPIYSLILPFTILLGQHVFMKFCIKLCDHSGRLLALFGINPIRER